VDSGCCSSEQPSCVIAARIASSTVCRPSPAWPSAPAASAARYSTSSEAQERPELPQLARRFQVAVAWCAAVVNSSASCSSERQCAGWRWRAVAHAAIAGDRGVGVVSLSMRTMSTRMWGKGQGRGRGRQGQAQRVPDEPGRIVGQKRLPGQDQHPRLYLPAVGGGVGDHGAVQLLGHCPSLVDSLQRRLVLQQCCSDLVVRGPRHRTAKIVAEDRAAVRMRGDCCAPPARHASPGARRHP
jgi:hypothetical protein